MRIALYILLLLLVFDDISASECEEKFERHKRRHDYYYWDYDDEEYDDRDSSSGTIESSTLICVNVSSLTNLPIPQFYTLIPRNYKQFMNISHSNIQTIQTGAFSTFRSISKLYLSGNHIKNIEPGAFANLTQLQDLFLDNNELRELKSGTFKGLESLTILDLSDNSLSHIDEEAFRDLDNLTRLDLRRNFISKLEDSVFENLTNLEILDLSGNPLGKFPLKTKNWPLNLTILEVSDTSIDQFDVDLSNTSIEILNLSSNQFQTFDFFLVPPSVNLIDLSKNNITWFNNLDMLEAPRIYFDFNLIQTINGLGNLSQLHLSHNKIEKLGFLTDASQTLREIDLSYNQISIIDKDLFLKMKYLERLNLAHNNIKAIDVGTFRDLSSLSYLNLSYNNIQQFQFGTFETLSRLYTLDISGNKLKELDVTIFHPLRFLRELHLDNNELSSLDYKFLAKDLHALQTVSLDKNGQWKCKNLVEIARTFRESRITLEQGSSFDVENFQGIACVNPKEVEIPNSPAFNSEEFYRNFQKVVNKGVRDSKINTFFNVDFKNSTLFRFFNDKPDSLKASNNEDESDGSNHLIVANIFQIILSVLLLVVVCLIFVGFKKYRQQFSSKTRLYYKPQTQR